MPSRAAGTAPPVGGAVPAARRKFSWRACAIALAALFGLYVFGGDFVLPPEYQWSTISGRIAGKTAGAATTAATAAKASEAEAVATAQETAKVDPQVEIAARVAAIEVEKAAQLAKIEVAKHAQITAIEIAKVPATTGADAYRQCVNQAQARAESAAAVHGTTLGAREIARQQALARAGEACEHLKAEEDAAREKAARIEEWTRK